MISSPPRKRCVEVAIQLGMDGTRQTIDLVGGTPTGPSLAPFPVEVFLEVRQRISQATFEYYLKLIARVIRASKPRR